MLTAEERNDIESTLAYGDVFGNSNVTQPLRRKVLGLDDEAKKYKDALDLIEALAVDGQGGADPNFCFGRIIHEAAFALRGEIVGSGRHRRTD